MRTELLCSLILGCVSWIFCCPALARAENEILVLFGTYTRGSSKGIYASRLDPATGKLTPPTLAAETPNPSFVALHSKRDLVYAVSEMSSFGGQKSGAVSAFSLDRSSGRLTLLNTVASGGAGPCFVTVDPAGKNVLVANYGSGSVAVIPIGPEGKLLDASSFVQHKGSSVNPKRQEGPHAHSINVSKDNRYAVAADLGLDRILVYKLDVSRGLLSPNDPPFAVVAAGSGPRHFAFHPDGKHAYVINEMLSTITAFAWDAVKGTLNELKTVSTLPGDFSGSNSTAEVRVHPSGKFLYGSNRGHNSIAVFTVEASPGNPALLQHESTQGKTPRNFGIDPSGRWLLAANQDSDTVVVFQIDAKTGRLTPAGQSLAVPSPVCVRFIP